MPRRIVHYLFFLVVVPVLASCNSNRDSSSASNPTSSPKPDIAPSNVTSQRPEKPALPLQLAPPAALPQRLGDQDLKVMDNKELLDQARASAGKKLYQAAATYQYWYVQKSKDDQYDLACYLARTGQIEAAFYWLQIAAIEQGLETKYVEHDEDLERLRSDPRWDQVLRYIQACSNYFESAQITQTVLRLPKGYRKPAPIPAILWLHGFRSHPDDFINDNCQKYADQLNVAMIGVSATTSRGPHTFVWTEDLEKDTRRVRAALAEVSDRVTIAKGRVIILGFSQGAQVGVEIAAQNPEEYAGSIVLSPGLALSHRAGLDEMKPSPLLSRRGFVLCCNADEYPAIVRLTALDADWLREAKAQVLQNQYPGISAHALPSDFDTRFPEWVKFIRKAAGD